MMKTKAAIITGPGELAIDDLEVPDPKPDQVIVKLMSTGVCLSQVHQIRNALPEKCPGVLGHEATGVVTHVGRDVTRLKEGDHAIVTWVPRMPVRGRTFLDGLSPLGVTYREELAHGSVYTWAEDALCNQEVVIPFRKRTPAWRAASSDARC